MLVLGLKPFPSQAKLRRRVPQVDLKRMLIIV